MASAVSPLKAMSVIRPVQTLGISILEPSAKVSSAADDVDVMRPGPALRGGSATNASWSILASRSDADSRPSPSKSTRASNGSGSFHTTDRINLTISNASRRSPCVSRSPK